MRAELNSGNEFERYIKKVVEDTVSEFISDKSIEEQKAIINIFLLTVKTMPEGFKNKETIVKYLSKMDIPESVVMQLLDRIEQHINQYLATPQGRRTMALKFKRSIINGLIGTIVGCVAAVIIYNNAVKIPKGEQYFSLTWIAVVWCGIIALFGIINLFRGLSGWMKYKNR